MATTAPVKMVALVAVHEVHLAAKVVRPGEKFSASEADATFLLEVGAATRVVPPADPA